MTQKHKQQQEQKNWTSSKFQDFEEFPLWRSRNEPDGIHEDAGSTPGPAHCHELWCRSQTHGSDPTLLWLWRQAGSYISDSTPSLGTSIHCMCGPERQIKKFVLGRTSSRK